MPMPSCNCHLPPSSRRSLGGAPSPPTIVLLLICTHLYCSLTFIGAYISCFGVQYILSNLCNLNLNDVQTSIMKND